MVTVTVSDGKDAADNVDPAVDDTIRVTITVTDVNEGPTFTSADPLVLTVKENTVSNANIGIRGSYGSRHKSHIDDLENLYFTLSMAPSDDASFAIDEDTGQLTTRACGLGL